MNEKLEKRRKKYKRMLRLKIFLVIVLFLIILTIIILKFKNKKENSIDVYSSDILEENKNEIENQKIKEIDSDINDWNLILVNKDNNIPEDYVVNTVKIENKYEIDSRIKEAIEKMLEDARKNGLKPVVCSAYRSTKYQTNLFNKKVQEYRKKGYTREQAKDWNPGT